MKLNWNALSAALALGTAIAQPTYAGTIQQTVYFKNATPQMLYDTFLNSREHAAALGAPSAAVRYLDKNGADGREIATGVVGSSFEIFGIDPATGEARLNGKVLSLRPGKTIVLAWRVFEIQDRDLYITTTLNFTEVPANEGGGAQLELVQALVPDQWREEFNRHWNTVYWESWRKYFDAKSKEK
jgi:hypothetical protein